MLGLQLSLCTDLISKLLWKNGLIHMNWLIFIQKKMQEKCLLCIELLLFLSLKMKLWHITDTGVDFANIPALTHAHLVEQLSCPAASSTCALQRSRAQRALGSCSCPSITPAGSAHPAAPQTPGSCLSGCQPELCRQREQDSAARAAWPKISCFWKRQINSTCMLCSSSVILICRILKLFSEHGYMLRKHTALDTWTHTQTHMCVQTPSISCLLHVDG